MAYTIYSLSTILIFIGLATILHLQFGITGIVNFGIAGFWGIGMYALGFFLIEMNIPLVISILLATLLTAFAAFVLGAIILKLEGQSILVATLAFSAIVKIFITTEKWLTHGVKGLGSVPFPIKIGRYSDVVFFIILIIITTILFWYTKKIEASPYGRLLKGIQDNETLAEGLGKSTYRQKLIFFTFTSGLLGFFGGLSAILYHFLIPRLVDPGVTFTVWIALIIGGRKHVYGGLVGAAITLGIFELIIEVYAPIPTGYSQLVPVVKMMLFGLTLLLVLMFKPSGILGKEHAAVGPKGKIETGDRG